MQKTIFNFLVFFVCWISISFATNAQSTNPAPYCDASFDDDTINIPIYIKKVTISIPTGGGLNNNSNSQCAFPHYVYYNNLPSLLMKPTYPYEFWLEFNVIDTCEWGVWIDYNFNNTFEASEKFGGGIITAAYPQGHINPCIPMPIGGGGVTRMRIRIMKDSLYSSTGQPMMPCNAGITPNDILNFGETEDYNVYYMGGSGLGINNEISNSYKINAFPNPVKDILKIECQREFKNIQLLNMMSQVVIEQNTNSERQSMIDMTRLISGIYLLKIDGCLVQKIIKE